jgi:hypothetical protein
MTERYDKTAIYLGPHTWEPCVSQSLTHRLNECGHLVVTDQLELCARNCLASERMVSSNTKDLDRYFVCSTCFDAGLCQALIPNEGSEPFLDSCSEIGEKKGSLPFSGKLTKGAIRCKAVLELDSVRVIQYSYCRANF